MAKRGMESSLDNQADPRSRSVYVAYTGGTIGMRHTTDGYKPEPGYLSTLMSELPQLTHADLPAFDVQEYDSLLDSANMSPRDWNRIAEDIAVNYERYDGFVVLHGTDSMAYTASALSFMLEGLNKPVILTGSQIPLCEARSDALHNLITSLIIAGTYAIPEVCLFFDGKLMRGNRSVKADASGFAAFESPNKPHLAVVGVGIEVRRHHVLAPDHRAFRVQRCEDAGVAAMRLFPGISIDVVRNTLRPPLKGLVLEAYGMGNAPVANENFLAALQEATSRDVVVVDVTQCFKGRVDLAGYAAGSALAKAGVIGGYDLTAEAALAKLFYLFALGLSPVDVKHRMQEDLRGELSLPDPD